MQTVHHSDADRVIVVLVVMALLQAAESFSSFTLRSPAGV